MQRRATWKWCVGRPEQAQPTVRTVADFVDALRGDRRGRDAARRLAGHRDAAARITHAVSIAARARDGSGRRASTPAIRHRLAGAHRAFMWTPAINKALSTDGMGECV